jgi:hypothetical protein
LEYAAEFREAIRSTIPLFIRLLEDKAWPIRLQSVVIVVNLANYGEWDLKKDCGAADLEDES